MQPEDTVHKAKAFNIVFPPTTLELPVLYANAIQVAVGANEFFISLGTVAPPEVKGIADLEAIDHLVATPLIRIAVAPHTLQQFIEVMSRQYEQYQRLAQAEAASSSVEEEDTAGD